MGRVALDFFSIDSAAVPLPSRPFRRITNRNDFPWTDPFLAEHARTYGDRFADGHAAIVLFADGALVFSCWIATGSLRIDELRKTWNIPPTERVVYDCITRPEFRGRGIYPDALRWICSTHFQNDPVTRLWIYADAENHSSRRGIEKAGFTYRGTARASFLSGLCMRRGLKLEIRG